MSLQELEQLAEQIYTGRTKQIITFNVSQCQLILTQSNNSTAFVCLLIFPLELRILTVNRFKH